MQMLLVSHWPDVDSRPEGRVNTDALNNTLHGTWLLGPSFSPTLKDLHRCNFSGLQETDWATGLENPGLLVFPHWGSHVLGPHSGVPAFWGWATGGHEGPGPGFRLRCVQPASKVGRIGPPAVQQDPYTRATEWGFLSYYPTLPLSCPSMKLHATVLSGAGPAAAGG